ncbi:MAG: hypothetical protein UU24_C0001G0043 [Candidatus Nomurabacteria bacterium GW2011_GWA2_40_9]|uniref:Cell division protein FtsA n=1 Tax=Candidatus Nomurabacteria bacterium GW2011_GWA2_40_9 TaxID=1618734 RepID=A0A0G0TS99_9BACT|nr:MAG: hypothetical protein UU24_C0001G0043 [Candidatus Nomurabacteria bacterium GW2011_GWA2_40_9]
MASSKNNGELVLVFDIGSSSVGGALFYMGKRDIPKIVFSMREPIPIEEELDIDRFLFLTLKALKLVAGTICMKGYGAPKRIFCILSSPWYASQIRIVRLEKETPFTFTNKLADELIQKEIIITEEEYLVKNERTENKVRPIELKNMKTILNGYATPTPLNQKAKVLEMNIFVSMSGDNILNKIEESIQQNFHGPTIKFSSFMMASFTVARDVFVNQDNFLLINIGGEVTDIAMIKKDVLRESVSYPAGSNFIVRGVANQLKCNIDEAKSYVSMYKEGHIEANILKKIDPVMAKLKTQWLKKFQESLSNITNDISIPATIFITVDPSLADFFSDIIKTEEFNQYSLTESKFRVFFLSTQALHGIVVFDTDTNRDVFLIIEAIYINNFLS